MIEQAKAERATIERLAIDAKELCELASLEAEACKRQGGLPILIVAYANTAKQWQALVNAYVRSLMRLNAIIRLAELSNEATQVCKKHQRYLPCLECWQLSQGMGDT